MPFVIIRVAGLSMIISDLGLGKNNDNMFCLLFLFKESENERRKTLGTLLSFLTAQYPGQRQSSIDSNATWFYLHSLSINKNVPSALAHGVTMAHY